MKFGRIVLRPVRPTKLCDLLIYATDAIARIRMVREKFGAARPTLRFYLFEELGHGTRVIPGIIQNLRTHQVGLTLRVA